jgi:hypothetical protein
MSIERAKLLRSREPRGSASLASCSVEVSPWAVNTIGSHKRPRLPVAKGRRTRDTAILVPPGTADNSPPLQRWDQRIPEDHSPDRGDRNSHRDSSSHRESPESAVPDGTHSQIGIALPPLKRWAIIGCPYRDRIRRFPMYRSPGKRCPEKLRPLNMFSALASPSWRRSHKPASKGLWNT